MKRLLAALLVTSLLVTGCGVIDGLIGGANTEITAPPPNGGEPTQPSLDEPDGVANAFFAAWELRDYAGMYSLLAPNSQLEYSLPEFQEIYEGAATAMTMTSVTAEPLSALDETEGGTARVQFRATYETIVLGTIEKDMQMFLVRGDNGWGITWTPSLIFPEMAGGNTLNLLIDAPSRANIYDREGRPLVTANAAAIQINIVPGEVGESWEADMLNLLSQVMRTPPAEIRQNYEGLPDDWFVALGIIDLETFQSYRTELLSYSPPLSFDDVTGRRYFDVLAPHVLGFMSAIPAEECAAYQAQGYQCDELVGRSGLELWGEQYLTGMRGGQLTAYTSSGQVYGQIAQRDPQPSESLYTSLDRELQAIVQDAIEDAYRAGASTWVTKAGGTSVVVIDVNTGFVLASASYPYFDPNILNPANQDPRLTDGYVNTLFNDPRRLFFNRATQGEYPPGSLFKPLVMAAALGSGAFSAGTPYTCTGTWCELGQPCRFDWKEGGHGPLTLEQGLTASCNPYFYRIGRITGEQDVNIIPNYAREFGLGSALGLQIAEESGLIPDEDWLWQTRGQEWTLQDSVNIAIGQGDVLATPTQMAVAVAAIANGGTVYRPQYVEYIGLIGEEPSIVFEPEVIGELSLTPDQLQAIRNGMRGVAIDQDYGTAEYRLGSIQIPVAGKTGTAEVSAESAAPNAWFGGFAPYDEPEIAIVIMVENGTAGSGVAAPIFRRIVERWYNLDVLDYPPDWFDPELFQFAEEIGRITNTCPCRKAEPKAQGSASHLIQSEILHAAVIVGDIRQIAVAFGSPMLTEQHELISMLVVVGFLRAVGALLLHDWFDLRPQLHHDWTEPADDLMAAHPALIDQKAEVIE